MLFERTCGSLLFKVPILLTKHTILIFLKNIFIFSILILSYSEYTQTSIIKSTKGLASHKNYHISLSTLDFDKFMHIHKYIFANYLL